MKFTHRLALGFLIVCLVGCAGAAPPRRPHDICEIFRERPKWYQHAAAAAEKWNVSIPVMMAIMHKESRYYAKARPPRKRILFIFPGPYLSSAFGYPQAIDSTWKEYQERTDNRDAERDEFEDAIDFIGWYCHMSYIRSNISKIDAYHLYMAYHEGQAGFNRKSHLKKPWLKGAAEEVQAQAMQYAAQLKKCESDLQKKRDWWPFW